MSESIVDSRDFTGWTLPDWARMLVPRIAGHLLDPLSVDSVELVSGDGYSIVKPAPRVLGFRLFDLYDDGTLASIGVGGVWDSASQIAECNRNVATEWHDDKAPSPGCSCGLYGFYNVAEAIAQNNSTNYVYAACAYTGQIIGHQYGLRAEVSEVIGLAPAPTRYIADDAARHAARLDVARDKYGLAADAIRSDAHDLSRWANALPAWIKVQ